METHRRSQSIWAQKQNDNHTTKHRKVMQKNEKKINRKLNATKNLFGHLIFRFIFDVMKYILDIYSGNVNFQFCQLIWEFLRWAYQIVTSRIFVCAIWWWWCERFSYCSSYILNKISTMKYCNSNGFEMSTYIQIGAYATVVQSARFSRMKSYHIR